MRFFSSVLAAAVLAGCPAPEATPTPEPEVCEPVDVAAIAPGGTLAAGCHLLQESLSITGDVVVEAGARIVVDPDLWIQVESGGSLDVRGTATEGVVIEGADAIAGSWLGLGFIGSGSPSNSLANLTLRHAGGDTWNGAGDSFGAVWAERDSRVAITDLTLEDNAEIGLHFWVVDVEATVDGLSVAGSTIPARMSIEQAGQVSGTVEGGPIHLHSGEAASATVLGPYDYVAEVGLVATGDLTLEAGVHLAFEQDVGLDVNGGTLACEGTPADPVVLTGTEAVRGYWKGVHFENTNSADNLLANTEIRYAGSSGWHGGGYSQAGLYLEGNEVRVTVTDSLVSDAEGPALVIDASDPAGKIRIEGTTFQDSEEGMAVTPEAVDGIAADVVVTGNDVDHLRVAAHAPGSGSVDEAITWVARDVPYFVEDTVYVYGSLEIRPGSTVVFADDRGLAAGSWPTPGGALTIGDASGDEVVLTGESPVAGFWKGVHYSGTSDAANAIVNTRIEYAGSSGWNGAAESQAGLFVSSDSTVQLTDVTFADNELQDAYASGESVIAGCSGVVGSVIGDPEASVCL